MRLPVLLVICVAVVLAVVVAVVIIYMLTQVERRPTIELACELPTERPFMVVPSLPNASIHDVSDAKAHAIHYFPEFSESEFLPSSIGTWFYALFDDESIDVYPDGSIIYNSISNDFDSEAPPFDIAYARAVTFVESHVGLGNYTLFRCRNGTVEDDRNTWVWGRHFEFHTTYEGYRVLGFDDIDATVYRDGTSLIRRVHVFGVPNETRQVISAQAAWDRLLEEEGDHYCFKGTNITSVELCYYYEDFHDAVPSMCPAWRFMAGNYDFFINAFTGEYL